MLFVEDFMRRKPVTITGDDTVLDAYHVMMKEGVHRLPVVNEETVIGIVSRSDVFTVTGPPVEGQPQRRGVGTRVKEIMIWNPITIGPHETIEQAAQVMGQEDITGLPVVDRDGQLVGLIGERDIFRAFVQIMGIGDGARLTYSISPEEDLLPSLSEKIQNFNVKSLILFDNERTGSWEAVVRIRGPEASTETAEAGEQDDRPPEPSEPSEPVVPVLDDEGDPDDAQD